MAMMEQRLTARGAAAARDAGGFSLALLVLIAIVTPDLFSFRVAGLLITPVRLATIALIIPAIAAFSARGLKFHAFDLWFFAFALWSCLCIMRNYGMGGIENAGQFLLETAVLYFIVVASISRAAQVTAIYKTFFLVAAVLLAMAPAEIAANRHIYLDAFGVVGGRSQLGEIFGERFGVIRVTTIFTHPILHGLFCAPLVAVIWYTETGFARLWKTVVVVAAAAVSLSSAPLLVIMLQFVMIAVEYATRWMKHRATIIGAAIISMLTFIHFTASRGLFAVVVILVLSPATAYYRRDIWDYGMIDVRRSPIFGIVVENWSRPAWMVSGSIDNFWLFQMLRGGVPSVAFLLIAIVLIYWRVFRLTDGAIPDLLRRQRRAWAHALAALLIGAVTVHLYGKAQPYLTFMIAIGAALVRLLDAAPAPSRETPAAAPSGRQVVIGAGSARDAAPVAVRETTSSPPRRRTWL